MIVTREGRLAHVAERRSSPLGYGWTDPAAIPPPGLNAFSQRAGVMVTPQTALQVDSVFTALRVLSNAVIKMGNPRAFVWDTDGSNRPFPKWLPNQPGILTSTWGDSFQFDGMARTVCSLGLFGEAFWYVLTRDYLQRPSALEVLNPAILEVRPRDLNEASTNPGRPRYFYGTGASRQELDPESVIHIPFLAMPGAQRGLSSIEYAGISYALALAAMEYGSRWFAQGASPSYLLSTDQKLGEPEVRRIAERFMVDHAGLEQAHLPLVVDSGLKVQKIQSTPDEAQYLKTLEYARMCIAAWFGLPSHLVGGSTDTGNVWGRDLDLVTPIPTPTGWTTMGEIKVGDRILGADGRPARVSFLSPIFLGNDCYEVKFNDGSTIVAGADHLWETVTRRPKNKTAVRTTRELAETVTYVNQGLKHNHRVRVAAPFDLPAADLPIEPYKLGVWLGDGYSVHGQICAHADDVAHMDAEFGPLKWKYGGTVPCATIPGLRTLLRTNGLLGNKHVPAVYLRGSIEQRLALLQGLMDTDGSIERGGRCEFSNTNEGLARAVMELARSLGWRPTFRKGVSTMRGVEMGPKFVVRFQHESGTGLAAFRLPRKLARVDAQHAARRMQSQAWYRTIVSVTPVPTRATRCLQVDNDDHLFLAGEGMVPTHNTVQEQGLQMQDYTISGYTVRLNEAFSSLLPRGQFAALDESLIARADSQSFSRELQWLRTAGVETPNEIRVTRLGLAPMDGGDELMTPLNTNSGPVTGQVYAQEASETDEDITAPEPTRVELLPEATPPDVQDAGDGS